MKEIGLFGYGSFGKLIYSFLKDHYKISVYDEVKNDINVIYSTVEACAAKEIIILAVPAQGMEKLLKKIGGLIKKDAAVYDVCSVKIKPVKLMIKYLPESCRIVGTHPLFGPESIKQNLKELKIVLCPVRIPDAEKTIEFLTGVLKLKVIICTPEEHDRQMGMVQGLTHFIGMALKEMNITDTEFKTMSYDYLLKLKDLIKNDSPALFKTIQKENMFAGKYRKQLLKKLSRIDSSVS